MGYEVDIELRDVKFKKTDWEAIKQMLIYWNRQYLIPKSDWRSFNPNYETVQGIFEDIGYAVMEDGKFIRITEFLGGNLGSDEEMFQMLAPYLSDCEIVYNGEDGADWKQVVKNGALLEVIQRDAF